MNEINLAINIPNNVAYKRIVLRKFFYMIFIDANGRKLYAYIASVFGGYPDETDDPKVTYKAIQYKPNRKCSLRFKYEPNEDLFHINSIENKTNSFFSQTDRIKEVWGECTSLNSEEEVNAALEEFYGDHKSVTIDVTPENQIIKIKDKDVDRNCIVMKGTFTKIESPNNTCNEYELSVPEPSPGGCYDGLEAMNWIKIEIELKKNILEEKVLFSISLEKDKLFTPDFTWYFAPPTGTVISSESHVLVGEKAKGQKTVYNVIQTVSDDTTVFFDEWSDRPESISERKKSRVLFKQSELDTVVDHNILSSKETITVSLQLETPQGPSNRQFFAGLLIAFLLAFCSDKTRINDLYKCLQAGCTCAKGACRCQTICNSITIIAPFLLLISFVSFALTPKKALSFGAKKELKFGENPGMFVLSVCRIIGIAATLLLMIYTFGLWLLIPDIVRQYISCQTNETILLYGALTSLGFNLIYVLYCFAVLKRKLYNFI